MQREVDVKNTQLQQDTQLQQKEGQLQQQATALRERTTETNWQQRELQALKVRN